MVYRVFPAKTNLTPTDDMVRFAEPFMEDLLHKDIPVFVSCTFTWDKPRAEYLADQWYKWGFNVELGGPAYDDMGHEFSPGLYVKEGAVITSRGCPKSCEFCLVPKREGFIRELKQIHNGHNVLDNNLFACSDRHINKVFDMLCKQEEYIEFTGGIDAQFFRQEHAELLATIKLKTAWFACDGDYGLEPLRNAIQLMHNAGITSQNKIRAYVLFDPKRDTKLQAYRRARKVFKMGCLPMAMLHRGEGAMDRNEDKEWAKLERFWKLPAIYRQVSRNF